MIDEELKEISLLGTDRRKLNLRRLPEEVSSRISENLSPEVNLLNAITFSSFRSLMGPGLSQVEINKIEPIIVEEKSYVPQDLSRLVVEVLDEKKYVLEPVLEKVLQFVISQNQILLPDAVVKLIRKGRSFSKEFKVLTKEVIGLRGNRILELNKDLGFTVAQSDDKWEFVSSSERLKIFRQLRETDAIKSIDKLSPEWSSENIKSKLAFLKIISKTLQDSDFDFLSEIYNDTYQDKVVKRKTDLECKRILIGCLCRCGADSLLEEIKSKLKPYVKSTLQKSKFKSLKKVDRFWDGKYLSGWLGLSEKNLDLAKFDYDPLFWLSEMIEILPFELWPDLLGRKFEDTVDYFINDKQFQVKIGDEKDAIFLTALIQNAATTQNDALLDALAGSTHTDESTELIALFTTQQFEKYVAFNKLWSEINLVKLRPKRTTETWSLAFTKKYVSELYKAIENGQCYLDVQDGHYIANHFHMDAAEHLATIDSKGQGEQWYHIWYNGVIKPISYRINIDNRLKKLSAEK